jgi:hypothetical protein
MSAQERADSVWVTVTLVSITCASCGIAFGMPDYLQRQRRRDGADFHCPNGHENVYRETDADKLRKQLEAEKQASADARERAARLDRQLVAAKGQITRAKKRATAGVCPVKECHRHFVNLERHMSTKHADYASREVGA